MPWYDMSEMIASFSALATGVVSRDQGGRACARKQDIELT